MRILLAVDFSSGSERAVAEFGARNWPEDTIVRVLSVVENTPPSAAELWFDAGGSLGLVLEARKERAEELVLKTAEWFRQNGLTAETSVRVGRRRKTIAEEAKAWLADVVVRA